MWPFNRRSKPHRRWRNACKGSGKPGQFAKRWPESKRGRDICSVCKQGFAVRRHQSREHEDWKPGTLVLHFRERAPETWWERFVQMRFR